MPTSRSRYSGPIEKKGKTVTELHFKSVAELGRMIRAGETSPTELTKLFLERLDSVARKLNAVVTITEERALREAAHAEAELRSGLDRGPLHGIPYGAKDLLAAAGYPTTWGTAPYRDQVFDYDAEVITRLRDAGAVLVAKLAMIELAGGAGYEQPNASFTGPCMTPWNTGAWAGGSSSGSGAAVAAGAVPFAIGSETQGSIFSPASYCGLSGLRPTYGRVSRRGAMALSWTMDKLGPLARTAEDCGLILNAIAGRDENDPSSLRDSYQYPPRNEPRRPFRIGVLESEAVELHPEVETNFRRSLGVMEDFATLETVELPDMPYSESAALVIRSEMAAAFEDLLRSGRVAELSAPEDRVNALAALAVPAVDYLRALRVRKHACAALDELFSQYDAVVAPTTPTVAPPIDGRFDAFFSSRRRRKLLAAANLAGLPGIAIPDGFGERGLPTSISITSRVKEENRAIAIANSFQERTDWHTRTPA